MILNCRHCNKSAASFAESLSNAQDVSESFITEANSKCIHTLAAKKLNAQTLFEEKCVNIEKEDIDIQVIKESPYLCLVLAGGTYSIVKYPPRSKKPTALRDSRSGRRV